MMGTLVGGMLKRFLTVKLMKAVVVYLLREIAKQTDNKIDDGLVDIVEEAL